MSERPLVPVRTLAPFFVLAAVVLGALALALLREPETPAVVSVDYTRYAAGLLPVEFATTRPADLERWFAAEGLDVRLPDLGDRAFVLLGGRRHAVGGRTGSFAVYRNDRQDVLIHQCYAGQVADLPPPPDVRSRDGHRLLVHRKATSTLVFWQTGAAVCVVTSGLPADQVVDLAAAAARVSSGG